MKDRNAIALPAVSRRRLQNENLPIYQLTRIERRPICDLIPNPRRVRTHSAKQKAKLAAAIRKFGEVVPILIDESSRILDGHLRLDVLRELGCNTVAVIRIDHLSETDKRLFVLAANRLAELAGLG